MSEDTKPAAGFSLRRWSARKRAAAGQVATAGHSATAQAIAPTVGPAIESAPSPAAPGGITPYVGASSTTASRADAPVAVSGVAAGGTDAAAASAALPPIESLTPQSDFTPFMRPDVEPSLRSAALRKLFADPHFNVMDGLDTYIDDYSKPDPISPDVVKMLNQARYIFAPPPTRLNAQGFVEDVPEEEIVALAQARETPPAIAEVEAVGAPLQAIEPSNATVLPVVPADAMSVDAAEEPAAADAAEGRAIADAPRQIRLPLDAPLEKPT